MRLHTFTRPRCRGALGAISRFAGGGGVLGSCGSRWVRKSLRSEVSADCVTHECQQSLRLPRTPLGSRSGAALFELLPYAPLASIPPSCLPLTRPCSRGPHVTQLPDENQTPLSHQEGRRVTGEPGGNDPLFTHCHRFLRI